MEKSLRKDCSITILELVVPQGRSEEPTVTRLALETLDLIVVEVAIPTPSTQSSDPKD